MEGDPPCCIPFNDGLQTSRCVICLRIGGPELVATCGVGAREVEMTPFALKIVRDYAEKPAARKFLATDRHTGKVTGISDLHKYVARAACFELTDVLGLVQEMAGYFVNQNIGEDGRWIGDSLPIDSRVAFLPSPLTWLEWKYKDQNERMGVLLEHHDIGEDVGEVALATFCWDRREYFGENYCGVFALSGSQYCGKIKRVENNRVSGSHQIHDMADVMSALAFINSPRIVSRRTHRAHAGLQKKVNKAHGSGAYELREWTEVVLDIDPPGRDGEPTGERLYGGKALHFCRAHLRIKGGRLERVRAHWRGDPSRGIVQSRYKVA